MKVLHFYRTYFPETHGGLEQVIRQICLNTKEFGIESRVLTLCDKPDSEILRREEANVIQVKRHAEIASCSLSLSIWKQYAEQIEWADVINLHYPWPFGDLIYLLSRTNKPTVVTYHSDIIRQRFLKVIYRPVEWSFLNSVDRIVATSPNYLQTSNRLQHYKNKVDIIPIGIDASSFPPADTSLVDRMVGKYGRDFFLFVGVLRYYKGLHILLDAMVDADFQVVIAGAGPIEAQLKEQAARLGLKNVHFVGYVSEVEKSVLYDLCRAVVLPSFLRSEAFGVTLLEGAMHGRPLVSAEIGSGMSHINIDGETGLVVEPGSSKSLRSALEKLRDEELVQRLGQGAKQRYERLFTGRIMGESYAQLYARLHSEFIKNHVVGCAE